MANLSDIITPSNMLTADNTQTLSNKTIDAGTNTLTGTAASLTAGFATTAGTVTTAAQGNITSVGELTSLAVTGNISAGNISATTFTGTATQVAVTNTSTNATYYVPFISNYTTGNYELRADTGLYYNPLTNQLNCPTLSASLIYVSQGIDLADSDYVNFGTSDDAMFFYDGVNNTMELELEATAASFVITDNGTHRVTFTRTTGAITTAGTITGGNVATGGTVSATGNVTGGNISTSGISASGNITGGNITTAGEFSAVGNVTGGNILTSGFVDATGNIAGGNLISAADVTTVTVTASGNVSGGNLTTTGDVSGATATITGNIAGGNISTAGEFSATGNVSGGAISSSGTVTGTSFIGIATSAQYADLAENYLADSAYNAGTVVEFGGNTEVTISSISHSTAVAGIVSTAPAYLMNSHLEGEHVVAVALTGRVPCAVQGPVKKGTVLVSGIVPGTAMAIDSLKFEPGCVIGKSMSTIETAEIKTIEVAVGRL
jgi:hypothetical protein